MRRGIIIAAVLCAVVTAAYFSLSKWAIRHEAVELFDSKRGRPVPVEVTVRRDSEVAAMAGLKKLPVAILNHGNTVKNTEYSFVANVLALRGYLVLSIQHDLPGDPPLVTKIGEPYVGRLPVYQRGVSNIMFCAREMQEKIPYADYGSFLMVGHSNGGDIAMYFAEQFPDLVRRVVTLDNLRVPLMFPAKFKVLSFRSRDAVFIPDKGVVPEEDASTKEGIVVVKTSAPHTDMSDRGPDEIKSRIETALDNFLADEDDVRPARHQWSIPTPTGAPGSQTRKPASWFENFWKPSDDVALVR
jgi:pimeloyl-ACP methyl ester carboxylesterase